MSSQVQDIQQEKKQYWTIFFALLFLNILVVMTRKIPIIFWVGVATAFSTVLLLFMHLKTERKSIHIIVSLTITFLFSMVVLIVAANYSVPEGTKYLNFEQPAKPAAVAEHEGEHHGS